MSDKEIGRVFNNADSFAMAFDSAWKDYVKQAEACNLSTDEKLDFVLETINNHPFYIDSPSRAVEIAAFRIKLLNLN